MNTRRHLPEKRLNPVAPEAIVTTDPKAEGPFVDPVHLYLIPVDPHRVFVRWMVKPEGLALAGLNREAAESRLALRFFRDGADPSAPIDEFPAESGYHEGFFSLNQPGGTIKAGLIVKGARGGFDLLTISESVTLPQPVATLDPPPSTNPLPSAKPTRSKSDHVETPSMKPAMEVAKGIKSPPSTPTQPPLTTELREEPPDESKHLEAQKSSTSSSIHLATHSGPPSERAPISLEITLRMKGRVAPGQRLRLGNREVEIRPDGQFSSVQRIQSLSTAWLLLQDLLAHDPAEQGPTLALLAEMPEAEATLVVHSSIEISGIVRDPAYLKWLPPGIQPDAAGCFRLMRSLSPGSIILPHCVLLPNKFEA